MNLTQKLITVMVGTTNGKIELEQYVAEISVAKFMNAISLVK